ncbi:DUF1080 domain-containing protein [Mariniblastus sp.]|jgi:hypothetical protein|nr:DUF1080 domain-containing protein [Mariniblastus sp.]MDB4755923.1 DUF1080 domain-containing protein [Mariniblastus sp.]
MKKIILTLSILLFASAATANDGWVSLFDGKSFGDWKANENKDSWKLEDGAFVCNGPRSHLFYMGKEAPFKNFHFSCQVMTKPKSNAGIYFHTRYQDAGWPKGGYECQVNNTHGDPRKTASIYAVKDVMNNSPAKDNVWYTQEIIVKGKTIEVKINGKTVNKYVEPEGKKAGKDFERLLSKGTFAFQAHDPVSKVYFKDIKVKKLD